MTTANTPKETPKDILNANLSNKIIHVHRKAQELLYIPTYISTVVKKISSVNHQEQTANLAFTAVFRFYVEGLPQAIIDDIAASFNIQINSKICPLKKDDLNATFRTVDVKGEKKAQYVVCTLRDEKEIDFEPHNLDEIPFDHLRFKLELEVVDKVIECSLNEDWNTPEKCKHIAKGIDLAQCSKKLTIKFLTHAPQKEEVPLQNGQAPKEEPQKTQQQPLQKGLTHTEQTQQNEQLTTEGDTTPKKVLSPRDLYIPIPQTQQDPTPREKFKIENVLNFKEKILIPGYEVKYQPPDDFNSIELGYDHLKDTEYNFACRIRFSITAWRNPTSIILKYNIPIIFLQLLILAILAQDDGLGDKISNIATIVLALVAFVPSIKGEISHVKNMTLLETIIYSAVYEASFVLLEAVVTHYYGRMQSARYAIFAICILCLFYSLLALGIPYIHNKLKRAQPQHESEFKMPKRIERDGNAMEMEKWHSPETGFMNKALREEKEKEKKNEMEKKKEKKLKNILLFYKSPQKCCEGHCEVS